LATIEQRVLVFNYWYILFAVVIYAET